MKLESPVFKSYEFIPGKYTCDIDNINPPLKFIDVPKEAKSLVLILEDPDAPRQIFTHWLLFNIDPKITYLPEDSVPDGAKQGINDEESNRYFGPCPPSNDQVHSYHFNLFALDQMLDLEEGITKQKLISSMENHILAIAKLVGLYQR